MDIAVFSKCLKDLILRNDTVNVPGLGCFFADLMPASFADKGITINPPYRKLYFRAAERPDGDLFLKRLSEEINEKEDAAGVLENFIKAFKADLNKKKNVRLGELGVMRATAQNCYFFIADSELDIYPDGAGLKPVQIKYVEQPEETEIQEETVISEPEVEIPAEEPEIVAAAAPEPEPQPEPEPEPEAIYEPLCTNSRKSFPWWGILLTALVAVILIIIVICLLADILPAAAAVRDFLDNILYQILYNKEELELLGR